MKDWFRKKAYWLYIPLQRLYDELRYFLNYFKIQKIVKNNKIKILDDNETINMIINNRKSLSRFGDGEFKWMLGIKQISFQDDDTLLKNRLLETFLEKNDNLLIGLPKAFDSMNEYTHNAKRYWSNFFLRHYQSVFELVEKSTNKLFVNASITRPYIDYKNKNNRIEKFVNLKKIWDNREIIIVEGEKTKLGLGNDLFNNTKNIERIICPSTNAFSKYNDILNFILKQDKNKLILISLGPTATVLTADLSKQGFQAIDIGHIDIEYEWCINKCKTKKKIKGKLTNESINKNGFQDVYNDDIEYNREIIERI